MTDQTSVETTPEVLESVQSDNFQVFSSQPEPEPEKPAAEVEQETPEEAGETDSFSEDDTGDDAPQDKPKPKGVQKRIDELTANWRGAERDRDYWRDLAMRNQQQPQQAPQPQTAPAEQGPAKPDPKNFRDGEFDQGYLEALVGWKADERIRAAREEQRREDADRQQRTRQQEQYAAFAQKLASAGEDGMKVQQLAGDPYAPVTATIRDVALASENGMKVLAHLADNRTELQRIASMPDHMQAYEMARLETRLTAEAASKAATKAPDPFPTASGRSSANPAKDPNKMSQAEYDAWAERKAAQTAQSGW